MSPAGFPHSEICGSQPICGSPQLIAAYHVLHRLLTPRHPPCALSSLTEHSRCSMARLTRQLVFSCQRSLSSKPDESGWVAVIYRSRSGRLDSSRRALRPHAGGDSRDRTGNLRLAKPALSQLSYIPDEMVGLSGIEPLTSRLSGARSNHLSYRPTMMSAASLERAVPNKLNSARVCGVT